MPVIKNVVKLTIKSQNRYSFSYFSKCFYIHDSLYSHDNLLGLAGQLLSYPTCHTPAGAAITKYDSLSGFNNINLSSHPATGYKNKSFCYNQKWQQKQRMPICLLMIFLWQQGFNCNIHRWWRSICVLKQKAVVSYKKNSEIDPTLR